MAGLAACVSSAAAYVMGAPETALTAGAEALVTEGSAAYVTGAAALTSMKYSIIGWGWE
jgi:hypothetical protein